MKKKLVVLIILGVAQFLTPATHVVTTVKDSGPGSFRQAILDANADDDLPRKIIFAIESSVNVCSIAPETRLPRLEVSLLFDQEEPAWYSSGTENILILFVESL